METSLGTGFLLGIFAGFAAVVIVAVIFAARRAHSRLTRAKRAETHPAPAASRPPSDTPTRVLQQSETSASGTLVLPRAATQPPSQRLTRNGKEPAGNTLIVEDVENPDRRFAASVQEVRDLLLHLAELIARAETASGEATHVFNSAKDSVSNLQSVDAPEIQEAQRLLLSEIDRVLTSNAVLHSELDRANRGIAEQQKQIEELRVQARIDSLTRVPNRAAFDERLSEYVGLLRRTGLAFSLLLVDIDHFKNVNDEYGHISGDRILRGIATKLSDTVRDNDFVARYGGEEFAVIFPGTHLHDALPVAERIRQDIAKTNFRMDTKTLKMTISGGLAECAPAMTQVQVIAAADAALYQSKNAGRNRIIAAETGS